MIWALHMYAENKTCSIPITQRAHYTSRIWPEKTQEDSTLQFMIWASLKYEDSEAFLLICQPNRSTLLRPFLVVVWVLSQSPAARHDLLEYISKCNCEYTRMNVRYLMLLRAGAGLHRTEPEQGYIGNSRVLLKREKILEFMDQVGYNSGSFLHWKHMHTWITQHRER